jgi:hypothetical protein
MTAAAFLATQALPVPRALAQEQPAPPTPMTRADYEACQARDENGFRIAVANLTRKGLEKGLASVNTKSIVADEWRKQNLDDLVDKLVDKAEAEVRNESSWTSLLQSLASKEKAQELATAVTDRVYRSDEMRKAIESMATGVGREIGRQIEVAVVETAEPTTQCIQAFLGPRYGRAIARVVATGAGKEYQVDPAKGAASVSTGRIILEGGEGITGTVVLVLRRQLANMAARIGQRVVGAVLSRLVSVVAGGIGIVLIAKDIWDFRNGVLPIIADEMKSKATKEKVREELATSISDQIGESMKEIADKTAERVVEIWTEFRRAHAKVVDLADKHDVFKRYLDTVVPTDLARLDEIVNLVLVSEGEAGVLRRLDNGSLNQAVTGLPGPALDIAREARSLDAALAWLAVAGDNLTKVVDFELFRRAKPDAFSKASLARVLSIDDRLAVTRIAALPLATRDTLLEQLQPPELKSLGRALDERQLESLSGYLTGLEKAPAQRVLRAVALNPSRMQELSRVGVREAIAASPDQSAAVALMLETHVMPSPMLLYEHVRLVTDGRISPMLLWYKDPVALSAVLVAVLVVLLLLKRLLFGVRPKVIVRNTPMPPRANVRNRGGSA